MGNESSAVMSGGVVSKNTLQTQGEEHLWTVCLTQGGGGSEGVCTFTRRPGTGDVADLCGAAVDHLLLLRHPNIIKYLDSELSDDRIILMTEPVLPVLHVLEHTSLDTVVMGWRGLASGLDFLHKKAGLSHNNIHVGCVYVNVVDGQWKLGGFEAAARSKDINASFLSAVSVVRHEKATPPEDKPEKVKSAALSAVLIHSRDIWAYGHLMLTILEEAGLEAQISDSAVQYINDEMLNPDPKLRPTISELLTQSFMNNQSTLITDFLSNLTLKSKADKDRFFRDLAADLHTLSPAVVAEHIAPLLINPLVMAEPCARECVWKHLLLPATAKNPQQKVFKASVPCPLLQQDLFKAHVIPLLLDLMESREYHVRLTLLEHLRHFAPLCSREDLMDVLLPEVLVGLKDNNDELVAGTLHALGDLIPLLGADTVMGTPTPRKQIFTDAQPRTAPLTTEGPQPSSTQPKGPPSARKNTPPPPSRPKGSGGKRNREERLREMKEKREQQRLERLARSKLGHMTTSSAPFDDDTPTDPVPVAPPTHPSPQYSPSISHDEVEGEGLGGSNISIDVTLQSSKVRDDDSDSTSEERTVDEKWAGFGGAGSREKASEDWEEWSDIEATEEQEVGGEQETQQEVKQAIQVSSPPRPVSAPEDKVRRPLSGQSSSKLVLKSKKSSESNKKDTQGRSESNKKDTQILKGRLSTDDIQRIEEQNLRAKHELDLFADMAPSIETSGSFVSSGGTSGVGVASQEKTTPPLSSALQYQPEQSQDADGGDWGDGDWGDNF